MKRIIMMLIMMITIPTYATTMCAANDTVAVVLDPSLSMSGQSKNNSNFTWSTWNAQGTYYGIAACLSSAKGKSQGGYVSRLTDTINGETKLITGGEKNGTYCWCRLTHPVSSLWVFLFSNASCASACAGYCSNYTVTFIDMRKGLFGSVAQ